MGEKLNVTELDYQQIKDNLISYFENVWLAGNFLKGTLDGVNVNFTGIR